MREQKSECVLVHIEPSSVIRNKMFDLNQTAIWINILD